MVELTLGEFVNIVKRMRQAQVDRNRVRYSRLATMSEYKDAAQHAGELEQYVDRLCERVRAGTANTLF